MNNRENESISQQFSTTLHLNTISENTLYLQTIKHDYRKA